MTKLQIGLLLSALVGALFLAGCSTLGFVADKAAEHERVTEALVKNRTLAFIDGDPDRAEAIADGAGTILALMENDPDVELTQLREAVGELDLWGELPGPVSDNLQGVLVGIEQAVVEHAGDSEALSDRQRVRLRAVVEWIEQASEAVP